MKKFGLVLFGFLLGAVVMFFLLPELSFEQHTIDLWENGVAPSSVELAYDQQVVVTKIIDGDTIDVQMNDGQIERVRLVGIDTPETVDPRKKVQCFGPEASAHMKELLSGKQVTLESKPDEDRDNYGRLLRYVFLDGNDIGASMIAEGYAESLCNIFPHPKCVAYDALEVSAKAEKLGRWGECGE